MKVYAKEARGIQNSIKLMLLHPGVSISNDTQTQKDKHGYNTDSNVLFVTFGSTSPVYIYGKRSLPHLGYGHTRTQYTR